MDTLVKLGATYKLHMLIQKINRKTPLSYNYKY